MNGLYYFFIIGAVKNYPFIFLKFSDIVVKISTKFLGSKKRQFYSSQNFLSCLVLF